MGKSMKVMKAKTVSIIAKGKRARAAVFSGKKEKTYTGLKKSDLRKNKYGKIVAAKASAAAKRRFQGSALQKWIAAVKQAKKALALTGFVPVGGKSPQGKALYAKTKSLL